MQRVLLALLLLTSVALPGFAAAAPAQPPTSYLPSSGAQQQRVGGQYRIGKQLGTGSSATVWEGHHEGAPAVAIRVLRKQDAAPLEIEALEASRGLPFFAAHLGVHDADDTRFVVAENLGGYKRVGSGEKVEMQARDLGRATRIVVNVLRGLRGLHERGYVHGDVYPHNLMFDDAQGSAGVRIIDLGNARRVGEHPSQRPGVDVYRSAALLVGLVTGHAPRWGTHDAGSRADVDRELVRIPDAGLRAVLRKALSPDPDERYASAQAFRDALRPFEASTTRTPR